MDCRIQLKKWIPKAFVKAQLSSIIATLTDFFLTHFFTGIVGIWYLLSSSMGTVAGGVVSFLLGRLWVFNARDHEKFLQVKRYIIIWAGSLIINTLGVFLLTEVFKMHYLLSKALISLTVGVTFNFYFQKSFVFKI